MLHFHEESVEIVRIEIPTERIYKEIFFIPAIILLFFVILMQRRRLSNGLLN
ncbi:MAG: DUF3394 domain-containing protein [bacterium]